MPLDQNLEKVKQVKSLHEEALLKLPNVVGAGVGLKEKDGQFTDQLAIIVNVTQKKPLAELPPEAVVPAELDGIVTDVQEVGEIRAL